MMQNKKFALITGGSSGIGSAIAEQLAKRGYHIAIIALEDELLPVIQQKIKNKYKVQCHVFATDLSLPDAPEKVFEWAQQNDIRLNILVNNAGMGSKNGFDKIDADFYHKQLTMNVLNPVILSRLFVDQLKENAPAYILNLGSLGGFFSIPEKASYVASKAFIHSFSKSIAYELEQHRIYVSVLCPGGVVTNEQNKKVIDEMTGISRRSILKPYEIAQAAIDGLFRRQHVIIPGVINRSFLYLNRITPETLRKIIIKNQLVKKSRYD